MSWRALFHDLGKINLYDDSWKKDFDIPNDSVIKNLTNA